MSSSPGRIGARAVPLSSMRRFFRRFGAGREPGCPEIRPSGRSAAASASASPSARTAAASTRSARLDRYELLYEAGLVEEARRDGRIPHDAAKPLATAGIAMRFDHRRILATAIARLRAKLKYRPVVFELMPAEFTLSELQRTVEAISGRHLHKQNFRRLVETGALVEPTGGATQQKRRAAGRAVPLPPRRADGAPGPGTEARTAGVGKGQSAVGEEGAVGNRQSAVGLPNACAITTISRLPTADCRLDPTCPTASCAAPSRRPPSAG